MQRSPTVDELRRRCIVLGGGGHARVVIDTLQTLRVEVHGILDPNRSLWGSNICDVMVLGGDELLSELTTAGVTHFAVGVGGVGDNRPRQHLFDVALSHKLLPLTIIHPTATCSSRVTIGAGSQMLAGSIVNTGTTIGRNVLINTGAIVEHDCIVGDHVHLATGSIVAGAVRLGRRAHIGAGATVLQGLSVGDDALVAAGAVVVKDVSPGETVAGVPARRLN